jgi:hypothetical protein
METCHSLLVLFSFYSIFGMAERWQIHATGHEPSTHHLAVHGPTKATDVR